MEADQKKEERENKRMKETEEEKKRTRPSWPIRCDMWIVEQMRYRQTDQPTDQPTDTASYRGALSHLKTSGIEKGKGIVQKLI